jgi:2-haloacid dehalogenase
MSPTGAPHEAPHGRAWVLFDLDGTLFDFEAAEAAAVTATLERAGLPVTPEVLDGYREVNARHWLALERGETTPARLRLERWREVLHDAGMTSVDVEELAERYLGDLAAGSHVIDGVEEVLDEVATTHRIAFITNGIADVQRARLAASALRHHPEALLISEEVGAAKPDPAIFAAALHAMGSPDRSQVTMVGDSLSADIAGANAFGLVSVWVTPDDSPDPERDELRPTHRISDLRQLPPLLRGRPHD